MRYIRINEAFADVTQKPVSSKLIRNQ